MWKIPPTTFSKRTNYILGGRPKYLNVFLFLFSTQCQGHMEYILHSLYSHLIWILKGFFMKLCSFQLQWQVLDFLFMWQVLRLFGFQSNITCNGWVNLACRSPYIRPLNTFDFHSLPFFYNIISHFSCNTRIWSFKDI